MKLQAPMLLCVVVPLWGALFLSSCKKPAKNIAANPEQPRQEEPAPTATQAIPAAPPASSPPEPVVATRLAAKPVIAQPARPARPPLPPAPKPTFRPPPKLTSRSVEIRKANSGWPKLTLREEEATAPGENARLIITGEMRSQVAFQDSIEDLASALPGHRIVVDVRYGNFVRITDWTNRVSTLWGTYFNQIDNGTWTYDAGITKLEGLADRPFTIQSLGGFSEKMMEGSDFRRVENFLRVP